MKCWTCGKEAEPTYKTCRGKSERVQTIKKLNKEKDMASAVSFSLL